jgi:tetratricopeptide (TPR) repeat protein
MIFGLQPNLQENVQPYSDLASKALSFAREMFGAVTLPTIISLVVVLAILIAAVTLLKKILSGAAAAGGTGPSAYRRDARKLKRQGDPVRAAELFEMAGDYEEAAELYRKAGAYRPLGHLYEIQKNWMAAAGAYEAGRDFDKASVMYHRAGQYTKAAETLLSANKESSAAEMYEKGRNFSEAARLYERSGYLQKAAACYERTQDHLKAADLYEKCYLQEKVRANAPSLGQEAAHRTPAASYAQQSGRLYLKAGDQAKAARIFALGGFTNEAADAYVALKDYAKAAELYHASKQYMKAAELYQQLGQPQKAHEVMGEMYLDEHNHLEAARMFEKAGDFLQAGDLYEKSKQLKKAAEMYQRGGDFSRASELYQSTGDALSSAKSLEEGKRYKEAAQQYIKVGEYERAALLMEEAGDFYEAGMLFHKLGRIEDTIAFLQRVDSQSEHFYEATMTLGQIFMDRGMLDAAKERYKKLIVLKEISSENIEPYYNLALIYEKNREYSSALHLYEKIMAEDYNYRDIANRIGVVKEAVRQEKLLAESRKPGEASGPKGRYRILRKVGQGGMGVVFRAEDTLLNRVVAYKVLPPSVKDNPMVLENFLKEARVAAGINHPNIVTIYDTGTEGTEPYIIMEFVEGVSLKEILERTAMMPIKEIVAVAKQVCQALDYAHSKNVIHRDIKPANIMLNNENSVKIMDFGLAKVLTPSTQERTGVKGTPLYMSPEQIQGGRVDHRTDLYSLGCTLYRMACGRPPFTEGDVYYHHLNTPPQAPRLLNPQVPEALNQIILKCLEKDPGRRYQTAKEILTDLETKLQVAA